METQLKLAIGSDPAGYDLKTEIIRRLTGKGYSLVDVGCTGTQPDDYPVYAQKVAETILSGTCDRGILVCGTGQGMAMAANKIKGIRAALCFDVLPAILSREHNDANILVTGAWLIDALQFEKVIEAFLFGKFSRAPIHEKRIMMMDNFEKK